MDTKIKKQNEVFRETKIKLYNPEALDHKVKHRIKSIEFTDDHTRIDFIYRAPNYYINGGWVQIDKGCFIRETGTTQEYKMFYASVIPIAPEKLFFRKCGELLEYSLFYPALPKHVRSIDIIEKEAPGTYFNFYDVKFSNWMRIEHPLDLNMSKN